MKGWLAGDRGIAGTVVRGPRGDVCTPKYWGMCPLRAANFDCHWTTALRGNLLAFPRFCPPFTKPPQRPGVYCAQG